MALAKTENEWAERAARHIKAELKRANMTYDDLAEKLKKHGFKESKASIANKLARQSLPAALAQFSHRLRRTKNLSIPAPT